MPTAILWIGIIAAPLGAAGLLIWHRARLRTAIATALRERCVVCGCESVVVRDTNDGYSCPACGFDTDLEQQSELRAPIARLRRLAYAVRQIELASVHLRSAAGPSAGWFLRGRDAHEDRVQTLDVVNQCVEEARRSLSEAQSQVARELPDVPASPWGVELSEHLVIDIDALSMATIARAHQRMRAFLDRARSALGDEQRAIRSILEAHAAKRTAAR